jgi:hypothetical protein
MIKNRGLIKYGMVTNTLIGVFLRGLGDFFQQRIELDHKRKKIMLTLDSGTKSAIQLADIKYSWHRTRNEL